MGEISRARLLQLVGGLVGIASFFLHWVTLSSAAGGFLSWTSPDMIAITIQVLLGTEPFSGIEFGASLPGLLVVTFGLLLLLAASVVTLVTPYGGPLMFVASAISASGLTVMSVTLSTVFSLHLTPQYGAFVSFAAAIIAIMGLLYHRAEFRGQEESVAPEPEL